MNKSDLIRAISKMTDCNLTETTRILDGLINSVMESVAAGDHVTIVGFGTFKPVARAAKPARNPTTGAEVLVPATVKPKFQPGATFKHLVNDSRRRDAEPSNNTKRLPRTNYGEVSV